MYALTWPWPDSASTEEAGTFFSISAMMSLGTEFSVVNDRPDHFLLFIGFQFQIRFHSFGGDERKWIQVR